MKKKPPLPLKTYRKITAIKEFRDIVSNTPFISDDPLIDVDKEFIIDEFYKATNLELHPGDLDNQYTLLASLTALAGWMPGKQIYSFNKELWSVLTEKYVNMTIPMEILFKIPYKTIFLEPLNAFVFFTRDEANKNDYLLNVLCVNKDGRPIVDRYTICALSPSKTLEESLAYTIQYFREDEVDLDYFPWEKKLIFDTLQALLYICAVNADIRSDQITTKSNSPSLSNQLRRNDKQKTFAKAPTRWSVGDTVIKSLHKQGILETTKPNNSTKKSSGWKMRPHLRRAHWHHFWKGSGSNRELILKWIPPVFVNKDLGGSITTITKI